MKNITLLLIVPLFITSCSVTKNRASHKETTTTAITTHVDSTGHKVTDSTGFTRVKHSAGRRITERIDTTVTVKGDSMEIFTWLPEKGKSDTFKEGKQTIVLSRDSKGKVGVKASISDRTVTVQGQRETEDWNTATQEIEAAVHRDQTSHVIASAQVDSSRTTQNSVMSKESHAVGKWWLFGIVLLALIVVLGGLWVKKKISPHL